MTFEEFKKFLESLTDEQRVELGLNVSSTSGETKEEPKDAPKEEIKEKTDVEETEVKDGEEKEHDSEAVEKLAEEMTEEVNETPEEEKAEEIAKEAVETAEMTGAVDKGEAHEETPEIKAEEQVEETAEEVAEEEEIPAMSKTAPVDEEVVDEESGEAIPVDYQSIIDGMNAKMLALEAENRQLKTENEKYKSKVDGAFGFSAKPPMPAKVNKLYDDCADIKMHK